MNENPNNYIGPITTLGVGLLSASVALLVAFGVRYFEKAELRRKTALALAAEIKAIFRVLDEDNIPTNVAEIRKAYQNGESYSWVSFSISQDYFCVYKANLDKIGLLADGLPEEIVAFYMSCFATVDNLKAASNKELLNDSASMIQICQHLENLFESIRLKSDDLSTRLIQKYGARRP